MSSIARANYYEKVFGYLEKEKTHTWNWAAFFFGSNWMAYRKMYMYSILSSLFSLLWWVVLLMLAGMLTSINNDVISVFLMFLGIPLALVPNCLFGYYGNFLYYLTVKERIRDGYHLVPKYRPTSVVAFLFGFGGMLIVLGSDMLIKYLHFKNNSSSSDDNREINEKNIHVYLQPNKSKHWIAWVADFLVVLVWWLLIIIIGVIPMLNTKIAEIKMREQNVYRGITATERVEGGRPDITEHIDIKNDSYRL